MTIPKELLDASLNLWNTMVDGNIVDVVAAENIKKGVFFTEKNITVKRPGTGISPMRWDNVIGKKALRNFRKDDLLEL
jgi:sialic acid synthase SpsE